MHKGKNGKIWFLGRSYQEYVKMFSLKEEELRDIRILDCAAGASSFTPHLLKKGYDSTAVDLLYGKSVEETRKQCVNDFHTLMEMHAGLTHKVDWNFFQDPEDMVQQRISVYEEFIDSYAQYKGERYIKAALPELPFGDNSFDLVLSSHLLFIYEDRLGYDFHRDSILEMLRITSSEVRIYPILKLHGESESSFLPSLMDELSDKADFNMEKVDYQFRRGSDEMLKINKK
jgi:hypothetical protein